MQLDKYHLGGQGEVTYVLRVEAFATGIKLREASNQLPF